MKLLIITSLKEHQKAVAKVLEQAGVRVFSVSETTGFKAIADDDLATNWFAREHDHFNSVIIFTFTQNENAERALDLIKEHNQVHDTGFPVRAFVMPVEKASYVP
jgi:nitrogen regulatory protein PII